MKVRDAMQPDVITVTPETSYEDAARLMERHRVSGIPVVDKRGTLVGIVSEKDLFKALYPDYTEFLAEFDAPRDQETDENKIKEVRRNPVQMYMKRDVVTISPDVPIFRAGALMLAHNIHRIPVVENEKLVGIVTREDIYGTILQKHLR